MAGKPKRKSALRAPLLEIEYTDGREELISTTGLDVLSYEKYAKQEKWPNLADDKAGNHYLYYVGYAHLKRTGELNGVRFDAWADTVASLTDLNNEEPEEKSAEEPDPTEPTPSLPAPTTG